ncbi:transaldolase [Marinobacterium sp. D7]|uniref:transaldolase n=1 Tax=Marinobacterium ramblicola TaxID=2849041 RepID=UPI001C2D953F|nr:transaldolase [Marinobacterium ramblicola]MBV1787639.1 transaldolase [Marinobacterium ramblicola]
MPTLLEELKRYSVVVADTGDLDSIKRFSPEDATTNPSLILQAVSSGKYDAVIKQILSEAKKGADKTLDELCDRLIVAMGREILERIPGRVSTEVNARLSFDTEASVDKARGLIRLYEEAGVDRSRVLIKLAATWEGIKAAEVLEREGIGCNLTLIFSFAQARACAEAGVWLISPFVGRILDWHRKNEPDVRYEPDREPGVISVRKIYEYFREHNYPTIVMGASFRNIGEITALCGCDRLTISPALLEQLSATDGVLSPIQVNSPTPPLIPAEPLGESEFRWLMNEDAMATEKLAEGIRGFEADQLKLEALLLDRLQGLS